MGDRASGWVFPFVGNMAVKQGLGDGCQVAEALECVSGKVWEQL